MALWEDDREEGGRSDQQVVATWFHMGGVREEPDVGHRPKAGIWGWGRAWPWVASGLWLWQGGPSGGRGQLKLPLKGTVEKHP